MATDVAGVMFCASAVKIIFSAKNLMVDVRCVQQFIVLGTTNVVSTKNNRPGGTKCMIIYT